MRATILSVIAALLVNRVLGQAVTQIGDGQPQAPTATTLALVSQITDHQPQAPISVITPSQFVDCFLVNSFFLRISLFHFCVPVFEMRTFTDFPYSLWSQFLSSHKSQITNLKPQAQSPYKPQPKRRSRCHSSRKSPTINLKLLLLPLLLRQHQLQLPPSLSFLKSQTINLKLLLPPPPPPPTPPPPPAPLLPFP